MRIEWAQDLEIGVPVIDSEHRYLVSLYNDLCDRHSQGHFIAGAEKGFAHLAKYVTRHFRNEEALMRAARYPQLNAHIAQHENLADALSDLTRDFLDGKDKVAETTLQFLREWITQHVTIHDMRIGQYLLAEGLSVDVDYRPAYSDSDEWIFKTCSACGKTWKSFGELFADATKQLLGCMPDRNDPFYNLITFNCECGTTLASPLAEFIDVVDMRFAFSEPGSGEPAPRYCLRSPKARSASPCPNRCACEFTRNILGRLGNPA